MGYSKELPADCGHTNAELIPRDLAVRLLPKDKTLITWSKLLAWNVEVLEELELDLRESPTRAPMRDVPGQERDLLPHLVQE